MERARHALKRGGKEPRQRVDPDSLMVHDQAMSRVEGIDDPWTRQAADGLVRPEEASGR